MSPKSVLGKTHGFPLKEPLLMFKFWDSFVHLTKPPDISLWALSSGRLAANFGLLAATSCAEVTPVLATSGTCPGTEHWWWAAKGPRPAASKKTLAGPGRVIRWQKVMSRGHLVPGLILAFLQFLSCHSYQRLKIGGEMLCNSYKAWRDHSRKSNHFVSLC